MYLLSHIKKSYKCPKTLVIVLEQNLVKVVGFFLWDTGARQGEARIGVGSR